MKGSHTNLAEHNLTNLSGATFGEAAGTPKEYSLSIPGSKFE